MSFQKQHKQHSSIVKKLNVRRSLLSEALPGAVYLPFCGDADIATELYKDRQIYGADIDPDRVEIALSKLPNAHLQVANCDEWPFSDNLDDRFAIADFDAWSYPYDSFRAFLKYAKTTDQIVCFFTDGSRQAIQRNAAARYKTPDGTVVVKKDISKASLHTNYNQHVQNTKRYFENLDGWKMLKLTNTRERFNLYFGLVLLKKRIQIGGKLLITRPPRLVKFDNARKSEYLKRIREGGRRACTAREIGINYQTVVNHMRADPEFHAAVGRAEIEANEKVEKALYEQAVSGHVVACQVWLYNRDPEHWKDQRFARMQLSGDSNSPVMVEQLTTQTIEVTMAEIRNDPAYAELRRQELLGQLCEPGANGNGQQ